MRQKYSALPTRVPAERLVRGIPRATRKRHSAEDRIRNVLEGAGSKESIENIGKWGPETFSFWSPFLRHSPQARALPPPDPLALRQAFWGFGGRPVDRPSLEKPENRSPAANSLQTC